MSHMHIGRTWPDTSNTEVEALTSGAPVPTVVLHLVLSG